MQVNGSSWRLVNLALGLAAVLSFAGASGFVPLIVPARWLLAPWFSPGAMASVPTPIIFTARIGVNLWLIASVFMLLFWFLGLHRSASAPKSRWASIGLTLAWAGNIAFTFIPVMVGRGEAAGALMLVAGIILTPVYLVLSVIAVASATIELGVLFRHRESAPQRVPAALLAWAIAPPILSVLPLLFAPSNPMGTTSMASAQFAALCKDVGVRLMDKPAGPVRSIAYDWDSSQMSGWPMISRIEMDGQGKIGSYGGFPARNSDEDKKKIDLEFTESRPDPNRSGRATINPNAPYYRFPAFRTGQPYHGVEALSADVLAFVKADNPEELRKASREQGAVRYVVTLTDRRSGALLGMHAFVVDQVNKRGCGANAGNVISQNAFIFDAVNR